jgi:hypothetical protein
VRIRTVRLSVLASERRSRSPRDLCPRHKRLGDFDHARLLQVVTPVGNASRGPPGSDRATWRAKLHLHDAAVLRPSVTRTAASGLHASIPSSLQTSIPSSLQAPSPASVPPRPTILPSPPSPPRSLQCLHALHSSTHSTHSIRCSTTPPSGVPSKCVSSPAQQSA